MLAKICGTKLYAEGISSGKIFASAKGVLCTPNNAQQIIIKEKTDLVRSVLTLTSSVLSSRAVASQVFSTMRSLTSVFGMRTGGSFSLSPLEMV